MCKYFLHPLLNIKTSRRRINLLPVRGERERGRERENKDSKRVGRNKIVGVINPENFVIGVGNDCACRAFQRARLFQSFRLTQRAQRRNIFPNKARLRVHAICQPRRSTNIRAGVRAIVESNDGES